MRALRLSCGMVLAAAMSLGITAQAQEATFQLPQYERVVLPNGLTVLLLEKHAVPLVSVVVELKSGAVADPKGKAGTASLTVELLRKGTQKRTAEQVSADVDFIGMQLGTSAAYDGTMVSANFLKKDTDAALELIGDVLLHPVFPQDEFGKLKARYLDGLKSAKDQPQFVIQSYFQHALYGDAPYGRPAGGDEVSLGRVAREDVEAFYKSNYTPGNAVVAVAGDFDVKELTAKIQQIFGKWSGAAPAKVELPKLEAVHGRKLLLVDKPDATQTYFAMGNAGVAATNPDRAALDVVNTLYGGRFTSMLNTELRIKTGLTYGAGARFIELRAPGPFVISSYTKNATTEQAIDKAIETLDRLHKDGLTSEQIDSAKSYIRGSLPPQYETTQALAGQMAQLELYGISRDEFNANLKKIEATSAGDAKRIIDQYYPQSRDLVIVLIGKASEIGKIAAKYAPATETRKISEPGY